MTDTEPPAQPQPVVVTLPVEIDLATADTVCTRIAAKFADGAQVVVADLHGTTFCDRLCTCTDNRYITVE